MRVNVLDEWINSGEPKKVQAASYLLRDVPKSFVFIHVEFISNLIEQADKLGDDCYRAVSNDLFQSFAINEYSEILGETSTENDYITLRDRVTNIVEQLEFGSPSHQFYESILNEIKSNIKFWIALWEEMNHEI